MSEWSKQGVDNAINMLNGKVLNIGDKMRFSVELVDSLKHRQTDRTLLVEVVDIQEDDEPNTKILVLKNAEQ